MRSVLPILLLAILPACATKLTAPSRASPVPQPIEAEYSAPCSKLTPLQTLDLMAMALKLNEAIKLLDDCSVKHAHVVNAYLDAREDAVEWNKDKP